MADETNDWVAQTFYQMGGVYDPTLPSTDPKLLAIAQRASEELTKYRQGGINEISLKRFIEQLQAEAKLQDSMLGAFTDLQETAAKDRRVTAEQATRLRMNQSDNYTKLATQSAQFASTRLSDALSVMETDGKAAAYSRLFNTMNNQGVDYKRNDADIAALADQMAVRTVGKGIDEIDPARIAAEIAPNNQQLQYQIREFFTYGKDANAAATGAMRELRATDAEIMDIVGAGGPLTDDQIERLGYLSEKAKQKVRSLIGTTPEEAKIEEERLKAMDSRYRELQDKEALFRDLAVQPGKEGLRIKIGRLIANDEFRAWAEDHGYKLGQSRLDENGDPIYAQGQDDERAILAFDRQRQSGAAPRFLESQNTGMRVRVTTTDAALRERVLRDNDIGDGRYVVGPDGKTLMSPADYRRQQRDLGLVYSGLQSADLNGVRYVKDGAIVYKYEGGNFTQVASGEAVPQGWKPAMIYDGDEGRYMTASDLETPPKSADDIGFVESDKDKADIAAASPFKIVTADQLPSVGEVTLDGYLDKANAKLIAENGPGVISLNNGQYVIPGGAKIEVRESRDRSKPTTTAMERRAIRREARMTTPPLTSEQLRAYRARDSAVRQRAAETGSDVPSLALDAALDPEAANARLESLVAGGSVTAAQAAAARELVAAASVGAAAPAVAAPTNLYKDDAGYTFKVVDDNTVRVVGTPEGTPLPAKTEFKRGEAAFNTVVTKLEQERKKAGAATAPAAPASAAAAPAVAPAAAAPVAAPPTKAAKADYVETPDGAQYRIDEKSVTMVAAPRGEVLPAQPKALSIGSDEADALTERTDLRVLKGDEVTAIETRTAAREAKAPPPEVGTYERRGSQYFNQGVAQPDGDIFGAIGRMRREREARGEKEAPSAKPPAKVAGKTPFERRAEERRQAAMATSLATAADNVPERAPQRKLPEQNLGAAPMYTEVKVPGLRPGDASMRREEILAAGRLQAAQARAQGQQTPEVDARGADMSRYAPQPVAKGEEPKGTGEATQTPLTPAGKLALFRRMQQSGARPLSATPPTETAK